MLSLSNSGWQNRKESLNRSTNNEDMAETANRYVVREGVSESVSDTLVRQNHIVNIIASIKTTS